MASMFQNDILNVPVVTLWNGVDLLWVAAPCTVLFSRQMFCLTNEENQYTLCLTLGTQLQYTSYHGQYYTQSHVWLEINLRCFQLAGALFRFELQRLISAIVYMYMFQNMKREGQQDVTVKCLLLTSVSTCFGHHYAHLQVIKGPVTAFGVSFCNKWENVHISR